MPQQIKLRALEKTDLEFIHALNNNRNIMAYWFEEPYESFDELADLYQKHIHDNTERRFIAEDSNETAIGLVELLEIDYIHRTSEFAIIISPAYQGKGFARPLISLALDYAFSILNLNKVYLLVAVENEKAIHLYNESGFTEEGRLIQEVFTNGKYRDVIRMYILQSKFFDG
ncbi:spermidine N1-acetyltransferase [Leptothoe kymatousa]|uniref:Spermidine N1-acetyltransferase n=1 Tax=Leptothoe kymatousa TAU-MAC 1615 TaxID=2364775 RepID=A0ABS5Y3L3_9CYAN|nr:spermidine N1-acetyltransferase [Leptothoe kymatousa TAU-MAC 1615]